MLLQGKHQIPAVKSAKWCSLIPLNGPVTNISTSGFRWNLNKDTLEFGKFISTSQEFDGKSDVATVEIADNKQLLFSVDLEWSDWSLITDHSARWCLTPKQLFIALTRKNTDSRYEFISKTHNNKHKQEFKIYIFLISMWQKGTKNMFSFYLFFCYY